ncbi:MAG: hypothetical protein JSR69_02330 [Proteobacteria bacterium]|nr:hypothetical protein [Pseudomonadota bacterium]
MCNGYSHLRFILTGCLAVLAASVHAGGPTLSGPSSITLSERAVFNGGNFPPSSALTVVVTDPAGKQSSRSVASSASGTFQYELSAGATGRYEIKVVDGKGAPLGSALVVPVNP